MSVMTDQKINLAFIGYKKEFWNIYENKVHADQDLNTGRRIQSPELNQYTMETADLDSLLIEICGEVQSNLTK